MYPAGSLYFASFTFPDFLNYLLAAGALSIVFIPIFVKYLERGGYDDAWRALSVIANFILIVGGMMIALLMVFVRPLVEPHTKRTPEDSGVQFFSIHIRGQFRRP
jgi:peptidoglycan biosynthesis protein MviN/MurJ (putative lipid II flippase)